MNPSESAQIQCPYCGEALEITVDQSAGSQTYVEDCQICCRPIQLSISIGEDGLPTAQADREDE